MSNDTLNDILGIAPAQDQPIAPAQVAPSTIATVPDTEHAAITVQSAPVEEKLETDFDFARDKIRDLIKKGQDAVDSAILLAASGDNPRAYEVVGNMIGVIVQANKQLLDLHKTKHDTQNTGYAPLLPTGSGGAVNIERAVFIGRASDLLREIRRIAVSSDAQDKTE